jgi:hypothetical protein
MTGLTHALRYQTLFIYGLFAIAVLSVIAYLILTVAVIFATSHRTAAARASSALVSQIGDLESAYLSLQKEISPEQAVALGLVTPHTVSVVPAETTAVAFSLSR